MRYKILGVLALAALFVTSTPSARAQAEGDWPMYRHDLQGSGYSPLKQINTENVSKLTQAWSMTLSQRGGLEVTPIVVNGVMYLPGTGHVFAIEADTGKQIWSYDIAMGPTRGVAYWPGDKDNPPRIVLTSFNRKVIELDAATGKPVSSFGNNGSIDLDVGYSGVPTIYKNLAFLGASVGELPVGPPGDTRAVDILTGKIVWTFHSVAQPGEVGHDTWLDDGWKGRSGTNVWGWYMTVDPKANLLYMPIGGPSPNYYGGDRPGADLFGNSVVAVDATTGKLKWYFQTIHHDLWDQDLPPGPALIDVDVKGKKTPAVVVIGKAGLMYILNRDTGKPVFGVEERPVPKGDAPGEWYSPTQPFPLKPPPLARNSYKADDIVTADDTSPEHAKACQEVLEKNGGSLYNGGPFTAWLYHEDGTPPKTTIQFPGGTGGVNWGGAATDPTDGYVFVHTHDMALMGWIEKKRAGAGSYGRGTEGSTQIYDRASVAGPGPYYGFSATVKDADGKVLGNWPCQKPPWGKLIAVNANTGDIAWETVSGITEGLPEAKQDTGNGSSSGPIATAGGLVFDGSTTDERFRAYDSKTGKELWVMQMPHSGSADPMTYEGKNGKQYVAIVGADSVYVYSLP
ncbi:MAG TPA: PQQ-binding-like beta-propeller repeat protein [Candidatus Aquilonibacter sp.]|nr:PQQ-binding-like beta-propeller repeat protein [Candidatus Aquilonibacter sp.]